MCSDLMLIINTCCLHIIICSLYFFFWEQKNCENVKLEIHSIKLRIKKKSKSHQMSFFHFLYILFFFARWEKLGKEEDKGVFFFSFFFYYLFCFERSKWSLFYKRNIILWFKFKRKVLFLITFWNHVLHDFYLFIKSIIIQITQMVKDLFDWKQKKKTSRPYWDVLVYICQRGYPKNKYSEM